MARDPLPVDDDAVATSAEADVLEAFAVAALAAIERAHAEAIAPTAAILEHWALMNQPQRLDQEPASAPDSEKVATAVPASNDG